MNQKTRKNNTRQALVLPTSSYFTIGDIVKLNQSMLTASKSDITIRVRLSNAIADGKVVELGSVPSTKGRPAKVFALPPVQPSTINKAKSERIHLVNNIDKLVNVLDVTPSTMSDVLSDVLPVATPASVAS